MMKITRAGLPALLVLALLSVPALAQGDGGSNAAGAAAADAMKDAPADGAADKLFDVPRVGDKDTQVEMITGLCGVQMKAMSKPACRCLAEQSMTKLSDPQRDYLIATVVSPPVADRMLKDGRVGAPDQQVIFSFINATSDACASGTYDAAKATLPGSAPQTAPTAPAAPAN